MGIEVGLLSAVLIGAASSGAAYTANYVVTALTTPKPAAQDFSRTLDPRIQGSRYGSFIKRLYGTVEVAGDVVWVTDYRDVPTTPPGRGGKRATPDVTTHRISRSFGVQFCAGPAAGVTRITLDDKTFYQSATLGPILNDKLQIMLGTPDQMPNTWYEADKGVGRVSAHRGFVTIWFNDLDLEPYGDRIPNVRAEIVRTENATLDDIITEECALCDLTPSDLNVEQLSVVSVDAFFVTQLGPVRQSLEALARAYHFDGAEYDGLINVRLRPQTAIATVAWDELACVEESEDADTDEPASRLSLKRKQSAEIARTVIVSYFDKNRNYEENTQSCSRQNYSSKEKTPYSFNLVMPPVEASKLAKIIAVTGWTERLPGEFALPPEFFVYVPGDVLRIPLDETETDYIEMRIEQMDFSTPGVVRIKCVEQIAEAYDQTGDGTEGETAPVAQPVLVPCTTQVWFDDRPVFRYSERAVPGHYVAVAPEVCDPVAGVWNGVSVLRNVDGDGDYRQHAVLTEAATMGYATSVLPNHAPGLDTTNHIDFHLTSGTVASITDDAFNADRTLNLFAFGGETVQARDILDLGGDDYRASHLRRALFDTEYTTASHADNEPVVLLDDKVKRVEINKEDVGSTFEFLPVTFGATIDDSTPFDFEYGGRGIEPGGDVPSAVLTPSVTALNGQSILQWSQPADNIETLKGYRIAVYSDPAMTIPVAGYEDVVVAGNQFILPLEA